MLLIGAHYSISGGINTAIDRALEHNANVVQVFTRNARGWRSSPLKDDDVRLFHKKKLLVHSVIAHSIYLINLANPDEEGYEKSRLSLIEGLKRTDILKIPYLVLHPGAHRDSGEKTGLNKIADTVNRIYAENDINTVLLFENTAGTGTNLGYKFEHLAYLLDKVERKDKFGVCLDTCHTFAAGYDISTEEGYYDTISSFNKIIGLDKLKAMHINDSKYPLGSRKDRHQHIGKGYIGEEGFKLLFNDKRLEDIPKMLETPKEEDGKDMDTVNYEFIKSIYRG